VQELNFVWLEITGKCQLSCEHCYAASGPHGSHGTMDADDWRRVIDQIVGTRFPVRRTTSREIDSSTLEI
jgi:MoaA/NifB/PqqE/SkfB family radical SAM enzyme